MKYLKTIEALYTKIYRKGDYLLVGTFRDECLKPYVKVINKTIIKPRNDIPYHKYYVELLFPNTKHWTYNNFDDQHFLWITQNDIMRQLSKEEIKELKLELAANKFNI